MEVHHSHHPMHKKNWKEYFLEFFMLFFAVTLGFFAENIREHLAEKNKEKQIIEIVAKDLKIDMNALDNLKKAAFDKLKLCDTLRTMITSDPKSIDQKDYYRVISNASVVFAFNDNDKSRNDAESKGYFLNHENVDLAYNIKMYKFWLTDYKENEKMVLEHNRKYIYEIIPNITEPDILDKQWRLPFPVLESKIGIKPISVEMINKTKYFISNTKIFMDVIVSDVDSMTYYAKKTINSIENHD